MHDIYILTPFLITFFLVLLGFFVYERDTANPKNYFFLCLMCIFMLFNLFELKAFMSPAVETSKSFVMAQTLPLLFFPSILFCFYNAYFDFIKFKSDWSYLLIILPFLFIFLIFSKLLDQNFIKIGITSFTSGYIIRPGASLLTIASTYTAFILAAFTPFFYLRKTHKEQSARYNEAKSLFIAVALPFAVFLAALVYYKAIFIGFYNNDFIYPLGLLPLATLFSALLLGFSIIKYKSFSVSIIFNNALVYSVLTISISAIYVIIQNLLENFFQGIFKSNSTLYGVVSALIVSFIFEPLNSQINHFVTNLIDFFNSLNQPGPENQNTASEEKNQPFALISNLHIPYITFAVCFLAILFSSKLLPDLPPKLAFLISAFFLSITALNIIFNIFKLPFNMTAYIIMGFLFALTHVLFISITFDVNFYTEAFGILISALCLITAAAVIGRIISVRIDEKQYILPLCLMAAIADLWSVFYGVTSEMVTQKAAALNYLLVRYPFIGAGDLRQFIGISDFLFASIFMGAALNFKMNVKKTYISFIFGLLLTFSLVVITNKGIPAIPILAFTFIAANYKDMLLDREGIKALLIVTCGAATVFYVITTLRRLINK